MKRTDISINCDYHLIIVLTFAACNRSAADDDKEFKHEIVGSDSRVVTESEKSQAFEEHLIKRLQAAIELFDNVNEAVINIDSSNENEKTVDVLIITEPDTPLTDEQKSGIANIIKDSINGTVAVDIKEEQSTD